MTWGEFKAKLAEAGIQDTDTIEYMELSESQIYVHGLTIVRDAAQECFHVTSG